MNTELARTVDKVYFPGMWLLGRIILYPLVKTPEQGAQTTLHCSIDDKAGEETGLYYRHVVFGTVSCFVFENVIISMVIACFSDCKAKEPSALAKNPELAKKLWVKSMEMVRLNDYDMFNCSGDTLPEPLKNV